ncbi:FMN reductase [Comamonas testosteroni]|nr:FMN reductase [Comamonas testosteroni]
MSSRIKVAVVCGSPHTPSRTRVLLDALHKEVNKHIPLESAFVDLVELVSDIGPALSKDALNPRALNALASIEQADFLIVGSPVYRGGLPGLFKHLFDLVDMQSLTGKPVLLAATGGSDRHSLVIDHQWRPLLGFFQALTLPIGVYAGPDDIANGEVTSSALEERIALAIKLALPHLGKGEGTGDWYKYA